MGLNIGGVVKSNLAVHKFFWSFIFLYPVLYRLFGGVSQSQRVMHVLALLLVGVLLLCKRQIKVARSGFLFYALYLVLVIAYYTALTLVYTEDKSWSDFVDISRPIVYSLYILFPVLFPLRENELVLILRFLIKLVLATVFFSVFVYFPPLYPLVDLYKGRMSDDAVIMHFFRWSGTFGYPSDYAFILSFFLYFLFFLYVFRATSEVKGYSIILTLLFISLIMTVSRGGILSVLVMILFCYAFSDAKYQFRMNLYMVLGLSLASALFVWLSISDTAVLLGTDLSYLYALVEALDGGGNVDGSTKHRLYEFSLALRYLVEYIPFGAGANRVEIARQIDPLESFYGYYFIKWGLLGYLIQIVFLLYVSVVAYGKSRRYSENGMLRAMFLAIIPLLLSVPLVFGFSSAMSDRFKCLPFYYLLCGYVLCRERRGEYGK